MFLAYRVNGVLISLCSLDKTKVYGYDIRDWFTIDGSKIVIKRKIDEKLESFDVCNNNVRFESDKKGMLQELD